MLPMFDVIPVIQNRNGVRIAIVTLSGVSLSHDSNHTDNGRLYGDVIPTGNGAYRLDLYSDFSRAPESLIARGTAASIGQYFALTEQNGSRVNGRARVEGFGETSPAILIVSFAVDSDVFKVQRDAAALPGYTYEYGLAPFHAAAMRRIVTSDLPSAVPYLYRGLNLNAFAPLDVTAELPDFSKIQSPESLRDAQANLVKSLSAQESEHLDEFDEMAAAARSRFMVALDTLTKANTPLEIEDHAKATYVQFGSFARA